MAKIQEGAGLPPALRWLNTIRLLTSSLRDHCGKGGGVLWPSSARGGE